jgi:thioredoxin 1
MAAGITNLTDQTFDEEIKSSDSPVLVDFWAEWCGPCHAIAPVLDQIADERSELKVVKLNIDEQPAVAQRYGVMSIPTLILFKDGEPQAAAVGAMPKSMLEERLGLASAAA